MTLEQELDTQMKLEKKLSLALVPIFNKISRDLAKKYAIDGTVPDAEDYQEAFEQELLKHYQEVQLAFRQFSPEIEDDDEDEFLAALLLFATDEASTNSKFITETNQDRIKAALDKAIKVSIQDNLPLDRRSIGVFAGQNLKKETPERIENIAITETTGPAENTKFTAAKIAVVTMKKMWQTKEDKKVRPTHVAVNKKTLGIAQFFKVGIYKMLYPGDRSMGAGPEEIARCRCKLLYIKQKTKR